MIEIIEKLTLNAHASCALCCLYSKSVDIDALVPHGCNWIFCSVHIPCRLPKLWDLGFYDYRRIQYVQEVLRHFIK